MTLAKALACAALMFLHFGALADQPTAPTDSRNTAGQPDPVEWIKQAVQEASGDISLEGLSISFELRYLPRMSPAQRSALKDRIDGLPDHPDRQLLDDEQRRVRGDDNQLVTIWYVDPSHFRLNKTSVANASAITDIAAGDGGVAWAMTENQLTVVTTKTAPPGRNYSDTTHTVQYYLGYLLYGGLRYPDPGMIQYTLVADDIGEVSVDVANGSDFTVRVKLEPVDGGASFDVLSHTVLHSVYDASDIGRETFFIGWGAVSWANRRVPKEVRFIRQDGSLDEVWSISEVKEWGASEVTALINPPDPTGDDLIRGRVTATSVYDFRPNAMELLERPNAESPLVQTKQYSNSRNQNMRLLGWAVFAGLGVLFLSLKYKRNVLKHRKA